MRRTTGQFISILAAVMFYAPLTQAQGTGADVGLTAGLNMSTFAGGAAESRSYRPDFRGGLSLIIPMSEGISVQPELLYSREGVKATDSGVEGNIKLSYITLPVMLRFTFGDATTPARPSVYAGPYFAMKVGCSVEVRSGSSAISGDCNNDVDGSVKSTDFGATVGGELGFGKFGLFARYSMGLTSIDGTKQNPEDIKNRVISVGGRWSVGQWK